MDFESLSISKKQSEAFALMEDPTLTELLLGGSAGGSKTFLMGMIIAFYAKRYPGARFFVGRKTLKSLKQSTIHTLISKVHPMLGLNENDFMMHYQSMELDYKNGSKIIFGELDYQPSDPDFARVGSLEIDMAFVDEAGEITLQAKNAIKSRVGRGVMANLYGIPGKVILSCNPSRNFLRQEYYDPYIALGGGGFQKWQIGETEVDGVKMPVYRGFLRMGAYDNPFLPKTYIDNLKSLPDVERRRLLDGDWNYADDDTSMFRAGLLEKATTDKMPDQKIGVFDKFIGVDLADVGKDKTVFSLMDNGVLVEQRESKVQMNWETDSRLPMGRLVADELVEFAQRNGFTQRTASQIAVEVNGVGASVRDFLRDRGWRITEYTATHKSRSENYYQLMMDMDAGETKILNTVPNLDDLKRQLSSHTFTMDNQVPNVVKKDKIKALIGKSPDQADSFMIANFCRHWIMNPELDPRRNKKRLIF